MIRLIHADWIDALQLVPKHDCVFVDPKDNIGLGYDNDPDNMPADEYVAWLETGFKLCCSIAPIVWFSINSRWQAEFGEIVMRHLRRNPDWEYSHNVQVFTFGNHQRKRLTNNHRPLWLINHKDARFYPDQILVESWRQRNGDKRAKPGGKVPSDVFDMQYPSASTSALGRWMSAALDDPSVCDEMKRDIEAWFQTSPGDVCDFPRVTGNSKQRCDWHPTQLHEDLLARVVNYSTEIGGTVLDAAAGTGTMGRVCQKLGRDCTLVDWDLGYCEKIAETQNLERVNEINWRKV